MDPSKLTLKQCREVLRALTSDEPDARVSKLAMRWRRAVVRTIKSAFGGIDPRVSTKFEIVIQPRQYLR